MTGPRCDAAVGGGADSVEGMRAETRDIAHAIEGVEESGQSGGIHGTDFDAGCADRAA